MALEPGFSPKEMEYLSHRVMIRNFPPFPELRLPDTEKKLDCLFFFGGGGFTIFDITLVLVFFIKTSCESVFNVETFRRSYRDLPLQHRPTCPPEPLRPDLIRT